MKLTKFAQSCILIETNGKKVLFDPGYLELNDETIEKWKNSNYIFITHKHGDHFNEEAFNKIKNEETKIFSTNEVAKAFPNIKFEIIKEKDIFELDGIKIEVVKAVHGYLPYLKGDKEIHENVGYILESENKRVYLVSDSISFKNDYKCNIIFVPVCNHGLVMGALEAALFAKETGAELTIPIHYDNPKYSVDLEIVKKEFEEQELTYKILEIGESFEI